MSLLVLQLDVPFANRMLSVRELKDDSSISIDEI